MPPLTRSLSQAVFKEFQESREKYGDMSVLDTRTFTSGMLIGQEICVEIESGKTLFVKLCSVSDTDSQGMKTVIFELNGHQRSVRVRDHSKEADVAARPKADPHIIGSVGAPMLGMVVNVLVAPGDHVKQGQPIVVLSAMKMETSVSCPCDGTVKEINVKEGDSIHAADLLMFIESD